MNGDFDWKVIVNHPWIKVSPNAGNSNQSLTITADANHANGSFRVGSITLRAEGVPDQTIYVSQQTTPFFLAVTAGRLKTLLTAYQKETITRLKLTGTIDARDFLTIGTQMPKLEFLDIRETDILAYADSSYEYGKPYFYPANTIPSPGWWNEDDHVRHSLSGHPSLKEVKLPLSLGAIGLRAFQSCKNLKTIELNSPLTNIMELAFWDCESLVSINLSPSVASIGKEAFGECSNLSAIELSPLQRVITSYCFSGCTSLKTLDIPPTITSIGEYAFENCTSLQSVTIPSSLTTVRHGIFSGCSSLTSVQLPPTITEIEPYAFSACTSLPYSIAVLEAKDNSRVVIQLLGNISWHAVSNQPWLTVSPESGDTTQTITLTAQANTSDMARNARITVSAPGVDSITITVTQNGIATAVDEIKSAIQFKVYPSLFTDLLSIEIANPSLKEVNVDIYSISGQKIRSLLRAQKGAKISLVWNGRDEQGKEVPKGMYLLKVNGEVRKVVKD